MNMFDIITKLANIASQPATKSLKEWGGDPADLENPDSPFFQGRQSAPDRDPSDAASELIDSWSNAVEDALAQYNIKGQLSDDQVDDLSGEIADDLNAPHEVVLRIVQGVLSERDDETDTDQEHDDDYTDWSMRQGEMGNYGEDQSGDLDENQGGLENIIKRNQQAVQYFIKNDELGYDLASDLHSYYYDRLSHSAQRDADDDGEIAQMFADDLADMGLIGNESQGSQGDVGGAHGEETISPVHGENMERDLSMESLRYLSGINKTITECGIPTAIVGGSHTPASINITASSGPELTGMLKDIMSLAGVRDTHKPIDVLASPNQVDHTPAQGPDMAALIRAVDEPEGDSDSMNDEPENEGMPELEGVPEKTENRPWDSSPHEKGRQDGVRKFGDINSGDHRERQAGLSRAKPTTEDVAAQLFADYKKFVSEAAGDEPAAPDADAIARRKRLQALKDKQEDDRAEKGSASSGPRKVGGTSYGGSKSKDDADLDETSYSAKKAAAGKDIGKPGKNFEKIAKSAGKEYGSKERGEKVAGAVLKKLRNK